MGDELFWACVRLNEAKKEAALLAAEAEASPSEARFEAAVAAVRRREEAREEKEFLERRRGSTLPGWARSDAAELG